MVGSTRGPERLIRVGQWLIALLFAYFLIQVGASLIADLPLLSRAPQLERYVDKPGLQAVEARIAPLSAQRDSLRQQLEAQDGRLQEAREAYERGRRSFETWRSARAATEQSAQNPEVIARARQLDAQLEQQRGLEAERRGLEQRLAGVTAALQQPEQQRASLQRQAQERFERAKRGAELRAFGIRLLFVGPLLGLSIWQFRRYRSSDQWPFVWGFLIFGLFAFFFELVPYLPSFGAYLRYGVGALLTFIGGRALIRWLQDYLQRKEQEQAAPQAERQSQIRYESALQGLSRSQCPSCERSVSRADGTLPDFCMHCGLQLQRDCSSCGHHQIAFFPFCQACGQPGEASVAMPTRRETAAP
jgi:hypothetical protein